VARIDAAQRRPRHRLNSTTAIRYEGIGFRCVSCLAFPAGIPPVCMCP
jgi:hypothetical protein